jgi:hypothetical protein
MVGYGAARLTHPTRSEPVFRVVTPSGRDAPLFDYLIGSLLQEPGHVEAECLGGLEIDD